MINSPNAFSFEAQSAVLRKAGRLAPVVFVLGKGGVGRTTIAAGLSVLAARRRGRSVLLEFGDGESGRRALAGAHHGVEHLVIKPMEAILRGATPLFGSSAITRLVLDNFAMRPLVRAAPAVRELAMLESVRQVAAERPGVSIFVDMPATGHSVAWLRVARQGRDFLAAGPLFNLCERVLGEILSPGRASIVVVTLPERLVVEETLELCTAITAETDLSVDRIVVNRVPVSLPAAALNDARALAAQNGPCAGAATALAEVLVARESATDESLSAIELLAREDHTIWRVPFAPVEPPVADVARWLSAEGAE